MSVLLDWYRCNQREESIEPPPPPPPDEPGGDTENPFELTPNWVTSKGEMIRPSVTKPNLGFSELDFEIMNSNRSRFPEAWATLDNASRPVGEALAGAISKSDGKKRSAFAKILAEVENSRSSGYDEQTKNANNITWSAYLVYDWTKDVISVTDKEKLIAECYKRIDNGPNGSNHDPTRHTARITGHPYSFYQHHDMHPGSFFDRKPAMWDDKFLQDKFDSDGRLVVNYFAEGGMSIHGSYTPVKIEGLIYQQWAMRHRIPKGKDFYHPNIRWMVYDQLYRMRPCHFLTSDGEYNDNHLEYNGNPSDSGMSGWNITSMISTHIMAYGDPIMIKFLDDLDKIKELYYNRYVAPYIRAAGILLYGAKVAANYDSLPLMKRSRSPVYCMLYKSKHDFSHNVNLRWFHVEINGHESYVNTHDNKSVGSFQIAGKGGWLLTGQTGAFSGTNSSHAFNWNCGDLGNNLLIFKDTRDDWEQGSTKRKNTGGVRYPLNYQNIPHTMSHYRSSSRGTILCVPVASSQSEYKNPDWIFDKLDLSKAYRGNNRSFYNRVKKYTRSFMTIPLNIKGRTSAYDGLMLIVDKIWPENDTVNNDRSLQFQAYKTPNKLDNRRVYADGAQGSGRIFWYDLSEDDGAISLETGWEGYAPSNNRAVPEDGKGDRIYFRKSNLKPFDLHITLAEAGDNSQSQRPLSEIKRHFTIGAFAIEYEHFCIIQATGDEISGNFGFELPAGKIVIVAELSAGEWKINGGVSQTVSSAKTTLSFTTTTAGYYNISKKDEVQNVNYITSIPTIPHQFYGLFTSAQLTEVKSRYNSTTYSASKNHIEGDSAVDSLTRSFKALMTGSTTDANSAYSITLSKLEAIGSYSDFRSFIEEGLGCALAFMWCKDMWSGSQRDAIESELWRITHLSSAAIDWDSRTLVDHHVEGPLSVRVTAAIATYYHNRRLWDETKDHFFNNTILDNRQWLKSGFHHQGNYIDERGNHLIYLEMVLMAMTGGKRGFYPVENLINHFVHLYAPDAHLSRWGDVTDQVGVGNYNHINIMMLGCLMGGGIAKGLFGDSFFTSGSGDSAVPTHPRALALFHVLSIIYDWKSLPSTDYRTGKKVHFFPDPSGGILAARSTWSGTSSGGSSSPLIPYVNWSIGAMQTWNHQHADRLHHYLYYGGSLLQSEEGYSGQWYGNDDCNAYIWQTVSHNSILIYDPDEPVVWRGSRTGSAFRTGGQGYVSNPNTWSKVVANSMYGYNISHYISSDEKVIYLSGDATFGYNIFSKKADKVQRSFFGYFTGNSDYPFVQFIFDRVWPANSSFPVVHLMHSGKSVTWASSENKYIISAADGGKWSNVDGRMIGWNLLGGSSRAINGYYASWDGQSNPHSFDDPSSAHEPMKYRFQFEKSGSRKHYFLQAHACVAPGVSTSPTESGRTNNTDNTRVGEILDELAVVFQEDGVFISSSFSFTLERSTARVLVTDLAPGVWVLNGVTKAVTDKINAFDVASLSAGTYIVTKQ